MKIPYLKCRVLLKLLHDDVMGSIVRMLKELGNSALFSTYPVRLDTVVFGYL